jgi:GntR family transcriptional regulator
MPAGLGSPPPVHSKTGQGLAGRVLGRSKVAEGLARPVGIRAGGQYPVEQDPGMSCTSTLITVEVDHGSAEPPYQQVAADLRAQIERGELTATAPSITTLMQTYGVARNTARKALLLLADQGYVRIVQGWGTFVAPRDETSGT